MKIVHVSKYIPMEIMEKFANVKEGMDLFGGAADYVVELAREQAKENDVRIIFAALENLRFEFGGLEFFGVNAYIGWPFSNANPFCIVPEKLYKDADIIHLHQPKALMVKMVAKAAKGIGKKIVATDHGFAGDLEEMSGLIDRFLCVSKYSARQFPKEKAKVVYGGVDEKLFRPAKEKKEKRKLAGSGKGKKNEITLLYAAAVKDHKRQEDAIRAFGLLSGKFPDLKLVFTGGIRQKAAWEKIGKILAELPKEISGKIIFKGYLQEKELAKEFQKADIYISPSSHELFGLSITQAMSSGKAVVAADVGAVSELVVEGKTGFLVEAKEWKNKEGGVKSIGKFAKAIEKLIESRKLREKFGKTGRKIVLKNFTWKKVAERCMKNYREILNGR